MRLCAGLAVAAILGVALGAGVAWLRLQASPWAGLRPTDSSPASAPEKVAPPRCVVEEPSFDFGLMGIHRSGSHAFMFRNTGTAPLQLSAGKASCSCALSKIESTTVPPGGSTKVVIEWKTRDWAEKFKQTVTILTNDPECPSVTLTITGQTKTTVKLLPAEVDFGPLADQQAAVQQVRLYGYLDQPLQVLAWKLADKTTAPFFTVDCQPLIPPYTEEAGESRSGVLLTISVKAGLLRGPFQQTILLTTNLETDPEIEVPIHGTIACDLGVFGNGWDATRELLVVGPVSAAITRECRLTLVARGPHSKDVVFSLDQVAPKELEVEIGKPTPIGDGAVMQTPLRIRIPKGTRPMNYLGTKLEDCGRIRLKTNHPTIPELSIFVYFAVESK